TTGWALLGYLLRPRSPLASRIGRTTVEYPLLLGALLQDVTATVRAGHADLDLDGLGVPALGKPRTGQEPPKPTQLDDHVATALPAHLVGRLVGRPDPIDGLLGML